MKSKQAHIEELQQELTDVRDSRYRLQMKYDDLADVVNEVVFDMTHKDNVEKYWLDTLKCVYEKQHLYGK